MGGAWTMTPPRGAHLLRQRIAAYFQARTPALVAAFRDEYDLEVWQMPDIVKYDAVDPWHIKEYPALAIDFNTDSGHTRIDYTEESEHVSRPSYQVVVAIVVETPHNTAAEEWADPPFDETIRLRDDYVSVIQNLLLNEPGLGAAGEVELDPSTINTTYLPPAQPNKSPDYYLASAMMTMTIRQLFTTHHPAIATVETINVIPELLTP